MTDDQSIRGRHLVDGAWLAGHLGDPKLRVLDCTVVMTRSDDGVWKPSSGRSAYDEGHIPGALFVDLLRDLHDTSSPFGHMLPAAEAFAAAMGALGIDADTRIFVYASAVPWWATRLWWMLRAFGHENVAVLDGGFAKWRADGHPVDAATPVVTPTTFPARLRGELIADKARVKAAVDGAGPVLVNALSRQLFTGESDLGYARPGRIAGSVLLSALSLVDSTDGTYLDDAGLRERMDGVLDPASDDVICYCGGGIAATMDAFALALLGRDDVAVYDGSLDEWSADAGMPMAIG